MRVALGTGSTAARAIAALAERFPGAEQISCVASSRASEALALRHGLTVGPLREGDEFAVMIDGADEVAPDLDLTKGGGGALFREKLLARHTRELVIAVDPSKLVPRLGSRSAVPIEIVPFARPLLLARLRAAGLAPALRTTPEGGPWITDNGNEILDLRLPAERDPRAVDRELHDLTGVIETGLFLGLADRVIIGRPDGGVEERLAFRGRADVSSSRHPNP